MAGRLSHGGEEESHTCIHAIPYDGFADCIAAI